MMGGVWPATTSWQDVPRLLLRHRVIKTTSKMKLSIAAAERWRPMAAPLLKACVDQDIEAYHALQSYLDEHSAMVDRCKREMGTYGWSMVKTCADQDIEAERALRGMRSR